MIKTINELKINEYINKIKELNIGKILGAYIHTFGCQQNEADSEKILGMAEKMGYVCNTSAENSDLIILNTCAVRHLAEDKALSMLGGLKSLKKNNPDIIIGVVGCMAAEKHIAEKIKKDFHYVDFTLEPNLIHEIPEMIYRLYIKKERSFHYGNEQFDIVEGLPTKQNCLHRAMISVMYGCNNYCSYCIVPYTRGRERSRSSENVLSECRDYINKGVKEIYLLGQNVNSYKSDLTFAELISKVAEIKGDFIIRFMTSHPKDASGDLIDAIAKYTPKIAPMFHLPLQSGSDRILKKMNRCYTIDKYMATVREIKEKIPNIALSTDIIVGFPGENEEDFSKTLSVLSLVEYDLVYAFIYSKRNGTPAAELNDELDRKEKSKRLTRLLNLQDDIYIKKNQQYIGNTVRVLVDSEDFHGEKRILTGKSETLKTVHFESDDFNIGQFVNVKINKAYVTHLEGKAEKRNI